jgi:hypothetical protein
MATTYLLWERVEALSFCAQEVARRMCIAYPFVLQEKIVKTANEDSYSTHWHSTHGWPEVVIAQRLLDLRWRIIKGQTVDRQCCVQKRD